MTVSVKFTGIIDTVPNETNSYDFILGMMRSDFSLREKLENVDVNHGQNDENSPVIEEGNFQKKSGLLKQKGARKLKLHTTQQVTYWHGDKFEGLVEIEKYDCE